MTFRQSWTLDATGNWSEFKEDSDGDGTWDLEQQRSCNPVNEITQITTLTGPTWATLAYDRNGNMTLIPKPASPTQTFTATYDPWNRLVKLVDTATGKPVAEYQYDARNRRIVKRTYDEAGNLSEVRHFYFTDHWQDIEERVTFSGAGLEQPPESVAAERLFVWGLRYIDELIARVRSSPSWELLDETIYALAGCLWNVAVGLGASGGVEQRFCYQAYGTPEAFDQDWSKAPIQVGTLDRLYTGLPFDPSSNLYDARNRAFNARCAFWTSRDPDRPSRAGGSRSLYEMADSSPIRFVDPLGLRPVAGSGGETIEECEKRLKRIVDKVLQDPKPYLPPWCPERIKKCHPHIYCACKCGPAEGPPFQGYTWPDKSSGRVFACIKVGSPDYLVVHELRHVCQFLGKGPKKEGDEDPHCAAEEFDGAVPPPSEAEEKCLRCIRLERKACEAQCDWLLREEGLTGRIGRALCIKCCIHGSCSHIVTDIAKGTRCFDGQKDTECQRFMDRLRQLLKQGRRAGISM
jgi:RHS repeat-associated protein